MHNTTKDIRSKSYHKIEEANAAQRGVEAIAVDNKPAGW